MSSSVLVATYSNASMQNGKGAIGGGKPGMNGEVEKGLLTLISSDSPGIQVPFFFLVIMVSERLVNLQMMSFASYCHLFQCLF